MSGTGSSKDGIEEALLASELTVPEAADLAKLLEAKWGVTAAKTVHRAVRASRDPTPKGKALRATPSNLERFERNRAQLEARNLELKKEAEAVFEKLDGASFVAIRQAGDTGQLYGSVSTRDISDLVTEGGFTVEREQVMLDRPIKALGLHPVRISLHPEVESLVTINVARSEEEAERQIGRGRLLSRVGTKRITTTRYEVILTGFGRGKTNVIKEVRAITGLGRKEAKELVEGAPKPVKEHVPLEEAKEIERKLEEAGATVQLLTSKLAIPVLFAKSAETPDEIETLPENERSFEESMMPIEIGGADAAPQSSSELDELEAEQWLAANLVSLQREAADRAASMDETLAYVQAKCAAIRQSKSDG